jgi:hypothetical protein
LAADREMRQLELYLDDLCRVLEEGYDCSRSKRKNGTLERCLFMKGRIIRVVVVKSLSRWNDEMIWLIAHVGEIHGK